MEYKEKLLEVAETLICTMKYIQPAALKNSKKGDDMWALYTNLVSSLHTIAEITGENKKIQEIMNEYLGKTEPLAQL